jgi:hypothetical protein
LERNLQFNSKSRDIWKTDQKGNVFHLKLSATMRSVEIFGHMEDCVLYFLTKNIGTKLEKYLNKKNGLNGPDPHEQSIPMRQTTRPTGRIPSSTRARADAVPTPCHCVPTMPARLQPRATCRSCCCVPSMHRPDPLHRRGVIAQLTPLGSPFPHLLLALALGQPPHQAPCSASTRRTTTLGYVSRCERATLLLE